MLDPLDYFSPLDLGAVALLLAAFLVLNWKTRHA